MEQLNAEGHKALPSREQADALHLRKPLLSTIARAASYRTKQRLPAASGTQAHAP